MVIVSWFPKFRYSRQVQTIEAYLAGQGLRYGADFEVEYHQIRTQEALDGVIAAQGSRPFIVFSNNTTPAEFVVKNGTRAPHVFVTYSDPLAERWIESYGHPGGTVTGVVEYVSAHGKRLQLLARLVPKAERFAILLPGGIVHPDLDEAIRAFAGEREGRSVRMIKVAVGDSAPAIAARLRAARAQAVYVPLPSGANAEDLSVPLYAAVKSEGLAAMSERRFDVTRGAVLALEVDRRDVNARVAHMIGLILRGTPPGSIPVHSPRRLFLTVNLDAAKGLGLVVPPSLLRQADFAIVDGK